MSGAVLPFTLPCNTALRYQWKKASYHCWLPNSNILKLKGFTNSFKNWQRPAPNAGSPSSRDDIAWAFCLWKKFSYGGKRTQHSLERFLLRAAVEFAAQSMCKKWLWLCWDVVWSYQNHVRISTAWKSSVSPLESVCKTHCRYLSGWLWSTRAPGVLHHVPPAYPNTMRHSNPCTCSICILNPGFACTGANLSIKTLHFWNNPWWQGKQGNCF